MLRKERNDDCMVAMEWQPEGKRKVGREERWKKNPGKRGRPAGQKSGAQHKTELVGETKLQPYAPHGVERTNELQVDICFVVYKSKNFNSLACKK